ncbi:MAG: copper amine oxidase N-terminal domain-containing protein [Clostridia bacterium]|nr:copper amine oxidase N-terminal domain-containing protein [Clostridia bacterium]
MKKSLKRIVIVASIAIIFICLVSVAYAAGSFKKIEAWYGVKIMYNNQELTSNVEPFIVDGSTYVPLRLIMTSFDKDITWDSANNKVMIYDKPTSTEMALRTQIAQKDMMITDLQAKLRKYESGTSSSSSSTTLSDLEDDLNDDYDDFDGKSFDITLSGSKSDVSVRIDVSSTNWSNMTSSKQTSLLQNICEDIRDKYDDAEVEGYVRSTSSSSKITFFYFNSAEIIRINANEDILNMEKELDKEYHDYLDSEDVPLYITLSGTKSEPAYMVNIDYRKYDDEWDDISDSKVKTLLSKIFDDIQDEFDSDDDDIDGYVYDTNNSKTIASYYKSSSGSVTFNRNR